MAGVGTIGRGRGSRGRPMSGSHSTPTSAGPPVSTGQAPQAKAKTPPIHWDGKNSARTARLIEWCKLNEESRRKIFSDSTKDAKEEGRTRQQMNKQKTTYYKELAVAIFNNDEDPKVRNHFQAHPLAFEKPIRSRFIK